MRRSLLSFQEPFQKVEFGGGVGVVAQRHVHVLAAHQDALVMGEGVEAGLAVVGAHAAVAHPAEG